MVQAKSVSSKENRVRTDSGYQCIASTAYK